MKRLQLPTFLGIGSMRCGSTWLYQVLRRHPDVHLSGRRKEVDFFFTPHMLQRDLEWYASHFDGSDGSGKKPIPGEISPRYGRLKAWQVRRIAKLIPGLRIVLTIRHPVERIWSQAIYDFGHLQGRDPADINSLAFLRQFESARSRLSSDYGRTIDIWSEAFGREALHIDLFERLHADPQGYTNDILRHIGASTPWSVPCETLAEKAYSTASLVKTKVEISELLRWYIARQWLHPTEGLNERLQGRVTHWVEDLRSIVRESRPSWRLLREVNWRLLSTPEHLAYGVYDGIRDVRLWRRWAALTREALPSRDAS